MELTKETEFQRITMSVMKTYQSEMHEYLSRHSDGSITDADVIFMIMNLSVGISTDIYYTLKQILPSTQMDFDFMRASMVNAISDAFEKIKEFNPKETMIPLTPEQVAEVKDKGFTMLKNSDGTERKITMEDIMVKKEEADVILSNAKKQSLHKPGEKKIITSSRGF
jgi:hypothetical protein